MSNFWIPLGIILVTEIAEKSRIAGFLLVTTFRSPIQVFWEMTLAYALLEGIAGEAGAFIPAIVPLAMAVVRVCSIVIASLP